ncbi:hypothetical protein AAIH70_16380 [Neorhizobium sp. BT27B]|uniref:hypothetical protein n=1 Tax=Neorhizobium sp. BT27B TaxID=3142625 RepID=UPI003D2DA8DA
MDSEKRLAIFERARSRAEAAGTPIESDPQFTAWVGQWIQGEIDLNELKHRYGELLKDRAVLKRDAIP